MVLHYTALSMVGIHFVCIVLYNFYKYSQIWLSVTGDLTTLAGLTDEEGNEEYYRISSLFNRIL